MKRSQAISLVLLAGAGATAFAVAKLDPSQNEEDALIYRAQDECLSAALRPGDECRDEYAAAERAYRASAPRYEDEATCARHHGRADCRPAADLGGPAGSFVPYMTAYMIGRRASQGMPPQPLYRHQPEEEEPAQGGSSGHGGGGYCTGAGGRVYPARGGVSSVSRSVTRTTTSTPLVIARGGFGFTGRGVAAHGSGGGHGVGIHSGGS